MLIVCEQLRKGVMEVAFVYAEKPGCKADV
jgi:hypothetical protein